MSIQYIEVSKIFPHPDNPRKELGDLTELADSIKSNGIFQNLTVIPKGEGTYTVIIGHRRLSAAKLAGLETVPCIVTNMSLRTQMATMLLENMQRSDLTVYEQAQGFQMMIDLGSTMAELSEKTGFSPTTIRHRINLLDLDKDKFKKSESRGARITDYIELEKIKSIELKNRVLQYIGTNNFHFELKKALDEEKKREIQQEWFAYFNTFAERTFDSKEKQSRKSLRAQWINYRISEADKKYIEKVVKENAAEKLYWYFDVFNYVYLLGDYCSSTDNEPEWKKAERIRKKKEALINPLEDAAHKCRRNFVRNYNGKKEDVPFLLTRLCANHSDWNDADEDEIAALLGIEIDYDEENDEYGLLGNNEDFCRLCKTHPQKVLLAYLFCCFDDAGERSCSSFVDYNMNFSFSNRVKKIYKILEHCGYELSDDEFKLISGTHPVFKEMQEITK